MHMHARAGPIVMRLGHEGGIELVRPRRRLHRALQQQAVERRADRIGAMLEIDLELAGTRLLHDRVDRQALNLADAVDVVDEGRQRVHLLEAEGERPARIVGETLGGVEHGGPVGRPPRDIELELHGGDGGVARAREMLDLIDQDRTGVDLILAVDGHHGLRMSAVADGDRHQRLAQKMAVVIAVAGLPQAARLLHAIAERIHDENRGRHHQAVLGDAEQVRPANAFAAGNAIHVEQNDVDPLHPRIGVEEVLRLVEGEPRVGHVATPLAAAPKRRNSETETGFAFAAHSGCHCTPKQNAASSGPRTASTRPSSAKASGFKPSARRAMPCQCSELTMISSAPTQSRNLPRSETG